MTCVNGIVLMWLIADRYYQWSNLQGQLNWTFVAHEVKVLSVQFSQPQLNCFRLNSFFLLQIRKKIRDSINFAPSLLLFFLNSFFRSIDALPERAKSKFFRI